MRGVAAYLRMRGIAAYFRMRGIAACMYVRGAAAYLRMRGFAAYFRMRGIAACLRRAPWINIFLSAAISTAQGGVFVLSGIFVLMSRLNSFKMSDDAVKKLDKLYDDGKFVLHDNEQYMNVKEEDDTGEDRIIYGFGLTCPLAMAEGRSMCKSFRDNFFCCQSVVSGKMARNSLAKHAFLSDDHPTQHELVESFLAANNATLEEVIETAEERANDRALVRDYTEERRAPSPRSRSRSRPRGLVEAGGGSHAPSSSSTAPSKVATQVSTKVAKRIKSYVKVPMKDLELLNDTFARALESQEKTSAYLSFFSRQIEAERKVFTEARTVIQELISQMPKATEAELVE
jgi:hypothetical protein